MTNFDIELLKFSPHWPLDICKAIAQSIIVWSEVLMNAHFSLLLSPHAWASSAFTYLNGRHSSCPTSSTQPTLNTPSPVCNSTRSSCKPFLQMVSSVLGRQIALFGDTKRVELAPIRFCGHVHLAFSLWVDFGRKQITKRRFSRPKSKRVRETNQERAWGGLGDVRA